MVKETTIKLTQAFKDELRNRQIGEGETYESIIKRLIKSKEVKK